MHKKIADDSLPRIASNNFDLLSNINIKLGKIEMINLDSSQRSISNMSSIQAVQKISSYSFISSMNTQ